MGHDKKILTGPGYGGGRSGRRADGETGPRRRRSRPTPYVELHGASAFSFLRGASLPEDLMARAAEVEAEGVAVVAASP